MDALVVRPFILLPSPIASKPPQHSTISILQSAPRQTKHWNDRSSNTIPTFTVQEALNPRNFFHNINPNFQYQDPFQDGTLSSFLHYQRHDRRRAGSLLCNMRLAIQSAYASPSKGARDQKVGIDNVRSARICAQTTRSVANHLAPHNHACNISAQRQVCCWSRACGTCSAERRSPAC